MTADPLVAPDVQDPGRLAALDAYDILDTAPEKGFDDVVLPSELPVKSSGSGQDPALDGRPAAFRPSCRGVQR